MFIDTELEKLDKQGLTRSLTPMPGTGGVLEIDGKKVLNFSSNDYLDLANDPRVKEGAIQAVREFGCGSTASRLMSGHLSLHEKAEQKLAELTGGESALIFGSGFLTNLGIISSLAGPEDTIFADKLNHASLIDGMRLSGAKWKRFKHKDPAHLEMMLKKSENTPGKKIIISDSVFSMDGDIAPVEEICRLGKKYGALVMIDEAHAVGILGKNGGGICAGFDKSIRPDIVVGTMSKSLGSYGGFAVCSDKIRDYFINKTRSFIYSTGLPPACLGSVIASMDIILNEPELREKVMEKITFFHEALSNQGCVMAPLESQIIPIHIGGNHEAFGIAEKLRAQGIMVTAIRPPTVPQGTARLRLSVTLAHSKKDLKWAAEKIGNITCKIGVV